MTLEDALSAISDEVERIDRSESLYSGALVKLDHGELTNEEFSAIADEYAYCLAHKAGIKRCAERAAHLSRMQSSKYDIKFIYDTTLNKLLEGEFSFILVIILTICLSAVFSREYESGAFQIAHTSKNGRGRLFRSKLLFSAAFTGFSFLLFTLLDIISCASNGAFTQMSASLFSLTPAKDVSLDINIGEYLFLMYLMRFLFYELFTAIMVSLSAITGKTLAASVLSSVLVYIPYGIGKYGNVPLAINISSFLSANKVLLSHDASAIHFIGFPLFAVLLLILAWFRFVGREKGSD